MEDSICFIGSMGFGLSDGWREGAREGGMRRERMARVREVVAGKGLCRYAVCASLSWKGKRLK
jgi:hypothetical protein